MDANNLKVQAMSECAFSMKKKFYSMLRNKLAGIAKFLLIFMITPTTSMFQQWDSAHERRGKLFHHVVRYSVRFLGWFSQALITLAYPTMGYNPLQARREQNASQWASQILGTSSLKLKEEAEKTIAQIQYAPPRVINFFGKRPSFTLLICFHHHLKFFKDCLDSINDACNQSPSANVQILIVNDDPSISSEELLAQASEFIQEKIILYSHEHNLGICQSANEAITRATGEWILHLDCDDRLTPTVFLTLERTISEHPHVRYISSRAIDIDAKGDILSWRVRSESPYNLIDDNVASHLKAMRRDLHEDIGFFNPLFDGCQDYEFALRTAINEPLCFIPDYLYEYRWHDQSQTVSNNKRQNLTANRIRQTYLLVIYWIKHGINNIQWDIRGTDAQSWREYLCHPTEQSSPQSHRKIILEATTPYHERYWKLLLVAVATIIIDRYRNHEEEETISVTI